MGKKVLVVDNNPVILRLLANMLQKENYQVKTAEDGLAAIEILEHFTPDFMLIDLIMPRINGEKLCRIIRKMPEFDSTYLIIISAIAAETQIDFLSFGANACIAKGPAKTMLEHIETVLNHLENCDLEPLSKKIFGGDKVFERDITKELLATKKHFEITLNNMADGFLELTSDANIIFANKASTRLFEVPEEELLSAFFTDLFSVEQSKLIAEMIADLDDQTIEVGEKIPIILHGRYLLIKLVPVFEQGQKFIIALIQDISKRKRAELELFEYKEKLESLVAQRTREYEEANKQLQEEIHERAKIQDDLEYSLQQWKSTFDTISDFVSVQDKEMKFVKVNKTLADFLGKKPEELIGKRCYEIMHNSKEPWCNCPHLKSMKSKRVITEEIEDPHIGGTLLVTCSPFYDLAGEVIGTVHIARDISKQKNDQLEREKLIKELNQALDEVKTLRGIIPICMHCKSIRDDKGYWNQIEKYICEHSDAKLSHGICEDCLKKHYPVYDSNS